MKTGPSFSSFPAKSSPNRGPPPAWRGKDTGSHPIYVWNPGAATENLPAIKPGENNKQ